MDSYPSYKKEYKKPYKKRGDKSNGTVNRAPLTLNRGCLAPLMCEEEKATVSIYELSNLER